MATDNTVSARTMTPVIFSSTLGTAIEWYDFFLYGSLSVIVFPKVFFPESNPLVGTLLSLFTFLVGFIARPFGGALFGHFGDRIGRKSTLIATLLLMGISTLLIGLLPGFATIGIAAPLILVLLRLGQGLGVGGEWGGSVLLAMEYGHRRNRGFWASWPQMGVPVGLDSLDGGRQHYSGRSGCKFRHWLCVAHPVLAQRFADHRRSLYSLEDSRDAALRGGQEPEPRRLGAYRGGVQA